VPKIVRHEIANPVFIMYRNADEEFIFQIHKPKGCTHEPYGLAICDLVRHVAKAFKVPEDAVWEWVDKERHRPTGPIVEVRSFGDSEN
jgi:hypothetical protein